MRYAGVFGNSGEEGESLVLFEREVRRGMGVVYDQEGTLWSRAGNGRLNRYLLDGRLHSSYMIPKARTGRRVTDALVGVNETLFMLLDGKLYARQPDDAPEARLLPLPHIDAEHISFNSHDGYVAAVNKEAIFRVNPEGDRQEVALRGPEHRIYAISLGPEGEIYTLGQQNALMRVDPEAPENQRGPWPRMAGRLQWINGYWYGAGGHGTLYRFAPDFREDPGVVLGGNSGSFIGYVPGNYEIANPRGMAWVEKNIFAVSGYDGIVHLLLWNATEKRFDITRRIGSVFRCTALALDDQSRLWWDTGIWEWSDLPDTPIRHGVPSPHDSNHFGAALLPSGAIVAPNRARKSDGFTYGRLDGPAARRNFNAKLTDDLTITAAVRGGKEIIIVNSQGAGQRVQIRATGEPEKHLGTVTLQTKTPVKEWTSLFSIGDRLLGTADGAVIELAETEGQWQEIDRWNQWQGGEAGNFGERIFATASDGRLWVSDTARHRVLCFDLASRSLIAGFGLQDQAGNSTATLDLPEIITANRFRAVVYDSANQRLVKLELIP